jgi:predicted dehydrogenase
LRSELVAFLTAIRTGETPAVTGEEAVASLEIATRCLEARVMPVRVAQRQAPRRVVG